MKKTVLSLISALIICSLAVCLFAGCKSKEEREKESFIPLARTLIESGVDICQTIYLGGGLEADVPADNTDYDAERGSYFPVLSEKYKSVASMKHDAELVFTPELARSWLYPDAFEGDRPLYKEQDGRLLVDITNTAAKGYGKEWQYDTIVITRISDVDAEATISIRNDDEDVSSMTVDFVRTEYGWRINSRLYD